MENENKTIKSGTISPSYYIKTRNDSLIYIAVYCALLAVGIYIFYYGIIKNDNIYLSISTIISIFSIAFIGYLIAAAVKSHKLSKLNTALTVTDNFIISQVFDENSRPVKNIISYPLEHYGYFGIDVTRAKLARIFISNDKDARSKTPICEMTDCTNFVAELEKKLTKI